MKIVIIGGTGLIGSKLAPLLQSRGHEVLQASPSRGVNAVTGEGLQAALAGADIVVDVSNSPSFEDKAVLHFFETGTRNLTAAAKQASVRHLVALSVVGTDRLESSGYFRAKLAQERLIANFRPGLHDPARHPVFRIRRRGRGFRAQGWRGPCLQSVDAAAAFRRCRRSARRRDPR